MWSYLFFMQYLDETDEEAYNYLEYYVDKLVEKRNISWFPIKRARGLLTGGDDVQKELGEIKAQLAMYVHACACVRTRLWGQRSGQRAWVLGTGWWGKKRTASSRTATGARSRPSSGGARATSRGPTLALLTCRCPSPRSPSSDGGEKDGKRRGKRGEREWKKRGKGGEKREMGQHPALHILCSASALPCVFFVARDRPASALPCCCP